MVFGLEFPNNVTQFCRISTTEALFFSRISKGKVTNLKFSRDFFSQKYVLNPSLDFFGITHYDSSVNDMV